MNEPTQDQIDEVLNKCAECADEGVSTFPGMSFEQGVEYAIRWMQGEGPHPFEE
ncbi:MAG: hypothetical protein ACK4MG_14260 [Aquabacterium sp.]